MSYFIKLLKYVKCRKKKKTMGIKKSRVEKVSCTEF